MPYSVETTNGPIQVYRYYLTVTGPMTISTIEDLNVALKYRPLPGTPLYLPLPTVEAIESLALQTRHEYPKVSMSAADNPIDDIERRMGGLFHASRLRQYMINQLFEMQRRSRRDDHDARNTMREDIFSRLRERLEMDRVALRRKMIHVSVHLPRDDALMRQVFDIIDAQWWLWAGVDGKVWHGSMPGVDRATVPRAIVLD